VVRVRAGRAGQAVEFLARGKPGDRAGQSAAKVIVNARGSVVMNQTVTLEPARRRAGNLS
jgi:flagellar basal body P-ring protein FlgI